MRIRIHPERKHDQSRLLPIVIRTSSRMIAVAFVVVAAARVAAAQTSTPPRAPQTPLTLDAALQYADEHYPSIRAAIEQVNVATAGATVARGAYLPRLDSIWQSNIATTNNIFGQTLPQSVIPSLSGPVLPATSGQGVWSSATGALFTWEPIDFGLRAAEVSGAEAAVTRARASESLTRIDVQAAVGAAFLSLAAGERAVAAAQADVTRRDVLSRAIHTLVDNQLRPGADASRADAERAASQTRLIHTQQAVAIASATLARLIGVSSAAVTIDAAALFDRVPTVDVPSAAATLHPFARLRQADVTVAQAQREVLARTDYPRVYVQSSVSARGSGASANGQLDSGLDGLGLDRVNWAAGVQVAFPNVFDLSSLRARRAAAAATTRSEEARYEEALLDVTSQQTMAAATVRAARAVLANTPVQLAAAQTTETQVRARYDAGLAALSEVAEAQSLLAQAELQDALARIEVWRALLATSLAQGSLTPFVTMLRP